MLGGNARPSFPEGDAGINVVAIGKLDASPAFGSATLLIAIRNNSPEGVSAVAISAVARVDGEMVATGSTHDVSPTQIGPGEVALGYIYFDTGGDLPSSGVDYTFSSESSPIDTGWWGSADLVVNEVNHRGDSIVGSALNAAGKVVEGPFSVEIYCFDGDKLMDSATGYAEEGGTIQPDASVHFSVNLYDTKCEEFAVGVSGYFS